MDERAELAVWQALYKKVGEMVSTRGDSLRTRADKALMDMYGESGVDRQRISINGTEVGTLGISFTKERTEREMVIEDSDALVEHMLGDGDSLRAFLAENAQLVANWFMGEGVVPDGCHLHLRGVPREPKGTVLRVDPQKVAQALGNQLPGIVAGLLEG